MNAAEKKELSKRQLYTLGKQGKPIIAHTAKTYPFGTLKNCFSQQKVRFFLDYYFKQRKTHSNGSINVLTAFNPAEYTMSVDFEVKNVLQFFVCVRKLGVYRQFLSSMIRPSIVSIST